MTQALFSVHQHCDTCNGAVDLHIDGKVAISCINSFASLSPALNAALCRLYALCRSPGPTPRASWLASLAKIWEVRLSRGRDRTGPTGP